MPRAWIAALAVLVLAAKLPTLTVPYYWDEMAWAGQARWLSEGSLVRALPGFHDPGAFQGRPPGLFLAVAIVWRVTGHSIAAAHLLIAALGAVGVCFTYLLGRRLWGGPTGFLAALLLFVSPIYFAQAGMFLADLPVAALGVASVYFAVTGRQWSYFATASAMMLVKETAVPLVLAIAVYQAIITPGGRGKAVAFLRASLPLGVALLFMVGQKFAYGHFAATGPSMDLAMVHRRGTLSRALRITYRLFVDQNRFVLTGLIALHLFVRRGWSREWWLFLLVCLLSGYSFTFLYALPRYILPVLPYLCLGAARSLTALARTPARVAAAGAVLLAVAAWPLGDQRFRGNGETDLAYLRVVRVHREAARQIAAEHPGKRVLTVFPHDAELRHPELGYAPRPVETVDLRVLDKDRGPDLALVPVAPRSPRTAKLLAQVGGWPRIARWAREGIVSELYASPKGFPERAPPPPAGS